MTETTRKAPKAITKREELEKQGWEFSHTATVNRYRFAGTVSTMKSKNGYEYCRIHCGKCVSQRCYQMTYVMRRKIAA